MPRKIKTPKGSTLNAPPSKIYSVWETYLNLDTYERMPINEDTLAKWAKDMKQWIDTTPDAMRLSHFYKSRRIDEQDFFLLCNKYPPLMEAKTYVLKEIGARRDEAACFKGANWGAIKHTLYQYDPKFKEADEHHAKLRQQIDALQAAFNILLPHTPMTKEGTEQRATLSKKKNKTIKVDAE